MTRTGKWKGGMLALARAAGLLAIALALVSVVAGCGFAGNAGSAKAHLGVPIDVQGHVTPGGGEGTLTGKDTGAPLASGAFAIYWPNVMAEAVAWFQKAVPDFATMLLGDKKAAPVPAVAPSSERDTTNDNDTVAAQHIARARSLIACARSRRPVTG